ncbi:orotidine-5'-phosphate decarboxylase [bacterium]|nr:orotidine-5'-phosphate decarboxylase [bacterium]MBU1613753.1 orotidine-5'-phosphate decarboxylase [bacterium]
MKLEAKDRLIVALDVGSLKEVERLIDRTGDEVSTFKVGSQLFTACGPEVVKRIQGKKKKVFLDLKYHDIPATVSLSVREAAKLSPFMLTLHTSGGKEMMKMAVEAVKGMKERPLLVGVTVLTSLDEKDLAQVGIDRSTSSVALSLALLAKEAGLDGVVASTSEIRAIKENCGEDFVVVTPGIRPSLSKADDQKRTGTVSEALSLGADFLVIGRPITKAANPRQAAKKIVREMSSRCNKGWR